MHQADLQPLHILMFLNFLKLVDFIPTEFDNALLEAKKDELKAEFKKLLEKGD